ncbi:MAG: hypothetical protein M1827_004259 [Pycnora praestabilis]|nr:MAG: hypothetical protein M1827_004259 [Pycnora praestabilis]
MLLKSLALIAGLVGAVVAQESSNQSQSDTLITKYINLPVYTNENQTVCAQYVPENITQYDFMYNLVTLALVGNYTPLLNRSLYQAQGILNPNAVYRDPTNTKTNVNLLPYFNGDLKSTNRDGVAVSVNFLDSDIYNPDPSSNLYGFITHMAQMLGVILGCDLYGYPPYQGAASQTSVHAFMDLRAPEMHYFIHNIYDAFLSMTGDTDAIVADGINIGTALDNIFNKLCSPAQVVIPSQGAQLQNMCLDQTYVLPFLSHSSPPPLKMLSSFLFQGKDDSYHVIPRTCASWTEGNATCSAYNETGLGPSPGEPVYPTLANSSISPNVTAALGTAATSVYLPTATGYSAAPFLGAASRIGGSAAVVGAVVAAGLVALAL